MNPEIKKDIEIRFVYHAPKPEQLPKYQELRDMGKALAIFIATNVPDSREQALALTHLEDTIMWANAGIARRS